MFCLLFCFFLPRIFYHEFFFTTKDAKDFERHEYYFKRKRHRHIATLNYELQITSYELAHKRGLLNYELQITNYELAHKR